MFYHANRFRDINGTDREILIFGQFLYSPCHFLLVQKWYEVATCLLRARRVAKRSLISESLSKTVKGVLVFRRACVTVIM